MRGIVRLIRELQEGDPTAVYMLVFAIIGTIVLVLTAEFIQRRRKAKTSKGKL
jgi:hypothetical protein